MPDPKEPTTPPAFTYEFGLLVGIALPHAYFLHLCGKLKGTESCGDTSSLYWFSPNHTVRTDCKMGSENDPRYEGIKTASLIRNYPLRWWVPPPTREHFKAMPMLWAPTRPPEDNSAPPLAPSSSITGPRWRSPSTSKK